MDNTYDIDAKKVLKQAELIAKKLNHPYVGTEHLLLSLLNVDSKAKLLLEKNNLFYDDFYNELIFLVGNNKKKNTHLYTPLLKRTLKKAGLLAKGKVITPLLILKALLDEENGLAIRLMENMEMDIDQIYNEINLDDQDKNLEIFNLGKDFNSTVSNEDILVGRDKEINLIIETLIRKNKNNPLLVGDAGVGKSAIVEELARRINKGLVPDALKDKKIVSVEMSSLISGTKYRGEFEEKMQKIIKEINKAKNIILFIDEIHTITNAGGAEGAINASDILKPYLARRKIKLIGATTSNEYNKFFIKDKALNRRFELIKINEPNEEETKNILLKLIPSFEKYYNVKIPKDIIPKIVKLTNRFILNKCNPDKSIDLLDSLCAMKEVENKKEVKIIELKSEITNLEREKENLVALNDFEKANKLAIKEININKKINSLKKKNYKITGDDIENLIFRKCNIPIYNLKFFDELEIYLNKCILGQEGAIKKVISTLKEKSMNEPTSILLVGSSGVGKTETVKKISQYLKQPFIRLDMSEYNSKISINKLIGAPAGYVGYDDEAIFDKVKNNPAACILLDEVEKAHPKVLNLFLQILDEGIITDAKGEKIDFKNTFIFMTSNAKSVKKIGFLNNELDYSNDFSKEFLGRVTSIVNFKDIDEDIFNKYLKINNIDKTKVDNFDYKKYGLRGLNKKVKCSIK